MFCRNAMATWVMQMQRFVFRYAFKGSMFTLCKYWHFFTLLPILWNGILKINTDLTKDLKRDLPFHTTRLFRVHTLKPRQNGHRFRHFQRNFFECKWLHFDSKFTDIISLAGVQSTAMVHFRTKKTCILHSGLEVTLSLKRIFRKQTIILPPNATFRGFRHRYTLG